MYGQTPGTDAIVVTAYGATGNLLGTASILACNVSDWSDNFLGIAMSDGSLIKSIGIDYSTNNDAGSPAVADLTFDFVHLPGDANLDGTVNGDDLNIVLSNFNQTGNWFHGDFNGDGTVNGADLNIALSNFNQTSASASMSVPEPPTAMLAIVAALALLLVFSGLTPFTKARASRGGVAK